MTIMRTLESDAKNWQALGAKPPEPCEFCGQMRYWKGFDIGKGPRWTHLPSCKCEKAVEAEERKKREQEEAEAREREIEAAERNKRRIQQIIGASGMGGRFLLRTFETFKADRLTRDGMETVKAYATNFSSIVHDKDSQEKNGILITGPKGTGKTHLAAAVANDLMAKGVPVLFRTMVDLLGDLRDSYDSKGPSEGDIVRLCSDVDLLIIDDLGKEQPTEWAASQIFRIINRRYEDFKPVVITSNYSASDLIDRITPKGGDRSTAEATIDRIVEMTHTVPLAGSSWRTK